MRQKIWRNRAVIVETFLTLAAFLFIFIFVKRNTAESIFGIFLIAVIFIVFSARQYIRYRNMLRRMTDEIAILPDDLSDKPYDHINDETRIFFGELARVKRLLDHRGRMRQELFDIVNTIATNMEFENLLRNLLPKLNEATRSSCSAFYAVNHSTGKLEIKHSVGFSKNIYSEFDLTLGEGLIGQAMLKSDITILRDLPEDTVYIIRTFLGKIKPRCLIIVPVSCQEQAAGALVCASIYDYAREDRDMIELIRHYLGVAVNNGINFEKNKRLTSELSFQNKLIQDQHEDMKRRLDEKTQLLNLIVDYIEEGCLYALDMKGVIQVWNKGAERVHGVKGSQAIGRNIDRVYDENNWPSVSKAIQRTVKDGEYTESFWLNTPAGYRFRYEMTMKCMYGENNEPIGILNMIRES